MTLSVGLAQGENPLNRGCYPSPSTYFGFNSGLNLSKVNYDEHTTSFNTSYQFGLEIESLIGKKEYLSSLLYGLSYESKKYEVISETNQSRDIQWNYLTLPIKYQQEVFRLFNNKIIFRLQLGGFYSFLINSSLDNTNSLIPNRRYGLILGTNFTLVLQNGLYLILDYNFQNGFAQIDNTTPLSSNISHVINIGFKVPSTAIF